MLIPIKGVPHWADGKQILDKPHNFVRFVQYHQVTPKPGQPQKPALLLSAESRHSVAPPTRPRLKLLNKNLGQAVSNANQSLHTDLQNYMVGGGLRGRLFPPRFGYTLSDLVSHPAGSTRVLTVRLEGARKFLGRFKTDAGRVVAQEMIEKAFERLRQDATKTVYEHNTATKKSGKIF